MFLSGTSITYFSGSLRHYSTRSKFKSATSPCDTCVLKEVGDVWITSISFDTYYLSKKSPGDADYHQLCWKGACQMFRNSFSSWLLKKLGFFLVFLIWHFKWHTGQPILSCQLLYSTWFIITQSLQLSLKSYMSFCYNWTLKLFLLSPGSVRFVCSLAVLLLLWGEKKNIIH